MRDFSLENAIRSLTKSAGEGPEIEARKKENKFNPVRPHWFFNAGANCSVPSGGWSIDRGILITSGALVAVVGDEDESNPACRYGPSQFCFIPAGKDFKWKVLVSDTTFYEILFTANRPVAQVASA